MKKLAVVVSFILLLFSMGFAQEKWSERPMSLPRKPMNEDANKFFDRFISAVEQRGLNPIWLRLNNVADSTDTAFQLAEAAYLAAYAAMWKWEDSASNGARGPFWVDSAGYADTGNLALDVDTTGSIINAALALRNNVDSDSVWTQIKIRDDNDTVTVLPGLLTIYGENNAHMIFYTHSFDDSCLFTLDVAGGLTISPSGGEVGISGNVDVTGTLNADSADIDGGVDISGSLEVGQDVRIYDALYVTNVISADANIVMDQGQSLLWSNAAPINQTDMYMANDSFYINSIKPITIDAPYLNLDGTFNKIRCGAENTSGCTGPNYFYHVTISPAFEDNDYIVVVTPVGDAALPFLCVDSALATDFFVLENCTGDSINWIAVKQ